MNSDNRQSFLGPDSDHNLSAATIGLVGLGGGGSHLVLQCAHLGIGRYILCDPDIIELSNTNRLVCGTISDVERELAKVEIAKRTIRALLPNAQIISITGSWQEAVEQLKLCDVIIGAVDSFTEREQLERFARRYIIPYIDIGMEVTHRPLLDDFLISGQVILSFPGKACLRCCNFITDERLVQEAQQYGAAGGRPQVVWPNGVLASTAIGLMVQLLTPWSRFSVDFNYLEYDGNKSMIASSFWVEQLRNKHCPHHPVDETGDPFFDIREYSKPHVTDQLSDVVEPRSSWMRPLKKLVGWLRKLRH
ncbi:MAG: ThiF family adenylyltransferase [Candidatus Melainabacteria bacterium]|nr:ThiF family adenylyltransferase [Candidatus Melainabacteria bacterium]